MIMSLQFPFTAAEFGDMNIINDAKIWTDPITAAGVEPGV